MPLLLLIKRNWDKLLLFSVILAVCLTNYTPGTWLIGWDNLLPELDIGLNLKRSLLAVWQEYQGLGLVGGMAHATDLIRQLILLPFTLTLPHSLIRYLWHFSMLFLGTFGIYYGLTQTFKFPRWIILCASLFYLLNFGSIQYFWAPLESFSTFWGFFPWLIFSLWNHLAKPSKLSTLRLLTFNLLAIPSFYVQTIFIVYLICLLLILFSHFLFSIHNSKFAIRNSLKILILIFFINSFWLLPLGYFFITNLHQPVSGIGNFMSTEESFQRNLRRGYLSDFLILRGYYTDFPDSGANFMSVWVSQLSNHYLLLCAYLLSFFSFVGLISIISQPKKLNSLKLSLLLFLLLSGSALLTATPPFAQINLLLHQSDLLNQIFRAPFTKFIVPAIFTLTLLSAFGLNCLYSLLSQFKYSKKISSLLLFSTYCFLLLAFSFPAFQGYYISPKMRQTIPQEYFQLFNYLINQPPTSRIANLPSGSYWGWTNYRFGIRGSGFLWYGIQQPILDRAFDTWNLNNEQYYWELTHALQKQDTTLFSNILQKYSITYVLFDHNIYFPDEKIYGKLSLSTQNFLHQVKQLQLIKQFGQISLYQFNLPPTPYILNQPTIVNTQKFFYQDQPFADFADYISAPSSQINYPFLNLFTNRLLSEVPYSFTINSNLLQIIPHSSSLSSTTIPLDNSVNLSKEFKPAQLSNQNDHQLFAVNFPQAKLNQSYLAKVNYQPVSGLPLIITANSNNLQNKYSEIHLNSQPQTPQIAWLIIPAHWQFDFDPGITILFNNTSLSFQPTVNLINDVNLYPFPYSDLIQNYPQTVVVKSSRTATQLLSSLIFFHQIGIQPGSTNSYLVLPQSFSHGWLAFYFNGLRPVFLKNHTLINNWANGWELPSTISNPPSAIYVLFWPQILEFLGFGLLFASFYYILRKTG